MCQTTVRVPMRRRARCTVRNTIESTPQTRRSSVGLSAPAPQSGQIKGLSGGVKVRSGGGSDVRAQMALTSRCRRDSASIITLPNVGVLDAKVPFQLRADCVLDACHRCDTSPGASH